MTGTEQRRRQRGKNVVVALLLLGFVVLFYLVTIVKLTANVAGVS